MTINRYARHSRDTGRVTLLQGTPKVHEMAIATSQRVLASTIPGRVKLRLDSSKATPLHSGGSVLPASSARSLTVGSHKPVALSNVAQLIVLSETRDQLAVTARA